MNIYPITPVAKPRMTRRDKWAKRPCVMQYRAFADEVRLRVKELPETYHVVFVLPMPKSWSNLKRDKMRGEPHQQKPDKDNLEKALLDALYDDDSGMWDGRATKIWGDEGAIIVMPLDEFRFPEAGPVEPDQFRKSGVL